MANYLITGGCGFIGSHLVESLLNDGHHVRILDDLSTGKRENVPSSCDLVIGDVADSQQVIRCMQDMDGCFHLAAIKSVNNSKKNWVRHHQVNLTGTINVLDAARTHQTPVVYASSAAVYGDNADMPFKERSAARPLTAYGADKLGSESHARVASLAHGVPTAGMRLFNVYGPRQDPNSPCSGVISIFTDHIVGGKDLTIFGDGEQIRDFIYVKDAVRFLREAMQKIDCNSAVFNVCTGKSITINQLAKTIMTITGVQVMTTHEPQRYGDIRVSIGDPSYAHNLLGVSAQIPSMEGLQDLIEYAYDEMLVF